MRELLEEIVRESNVAKNTITHVKAFLSGVYTWARNNRHFSGANPVTGVKLPKCKPTEDTYAYSLAEEQKMMKVLQDDMRSLTAVALASYAGESMSELEGLRWEDRRGDQLYIRRGIVKGQIGDGKTTFRRAPVPIIPALAKTLGVYHRSKGKPAEGWIFPSENPEKPMRMMNLYRRWIKGNLEAAGIEWRGWHAFRRGLATNLADLDVKDDVIQRVLRHGQLPTTQKHYRKTRDKKVQEAMGKRRRQQEGRGRQDERVTNV